jgi:hypothetical protein
MYCCLKPKFLQLKNKIWKSLFAFVETTKQTAEEKANIVLATNRSEENGMVPRLDAKREQRLFRSTTKPYQKILIKARIEISSTKFSPTLDNI